MKKIAAPASGAASGSLLASGAASIVIGSVALAVLGSGLISTSLLGVGIFAIASSLINFKNDRNILFKNLGLYATNEDGKPVYPKMLHKIKTDTGERWVLSLPYGLTTIDFEKVKYRLEQFFDAEITIDYENKHAILNIHTKKLPDMIEFEKQELKPNEWIVGVRNDGKYETIQFGDSIAHILIGGMTGYGKTNFLNVNLLNANLNHKPEQVKYWLSDLKGGSELIPFADARLTEHFAASLEETVVLLQNLIEEVQKRLQIRMNERKKSLSIKKYPPIICIIDEYPNLVNDKEVFEMLCYLARTARSVNVHLVLTTQRASREYVPGILKCNLAGTVCFATKSEADSEVILGKGDYDGVLIRNKGRAIYDTPEKRVTVQVPYISERNLYALLKPYIVKKKKEVQNDNRERQTDFGLLPDSKRHDVRAGNTIDFSKCKPKKGNCM